MRLQLLPLALCLFFAILAPKTTVFALPTVTKNKVKTVVNTALKEKTKKMDDLSGIAKLPIANSIKIPKKINKNEPQPIALVSDSKNKFEENSYNFMTTESVVRSTSSENFASAPPSDNIQTATFSQGLFFGFAIMVILLNMVCYFLFEEKLFMLYAMSLLLVGSLLFFSDGLLPLIGLSELASNATLEAFLVLASCFFGAWFASKYLNIQEVLPKLRWVSLFLLTASAITVALSWLSGVQAFASVANTLSFSVVGMYFLAGVYLFGKKNYPKFYVIAYSIPLLFAIDYFVFRNLGLEFLSTQPAQIKAAVVAEMLLLTYAIVYRMRAIKEENELRQTELRIFLKRQEVMNRKNAQQLMEEVYLENLIMHYDLDGFEIKLLQYISEGKDNVKIARKLKSTEAEIEQLTKELYHKLEISEHIQEDYRMVDAQADYIYN